MTAARTDETVDPGAWLGDRVLSLFATPVVNCRWPDAERHREPITRAVLALQRGHAAGGLSRSNVGGWHSDTTLLDSDATGLRALRDYLRDLIAALNYAMLGPKERARAGEFSLVGWANVVRHGDYHMLHTHPGATWSGVFYLDDNPDVADRPSSGKLELVDPRMAASGIATPFDALYGRCLINPRAGQTIVFPSWLSHCVHPYFGPARRLSIAFNATLAADRSGAES